jgi:hypothetical protein
MNCQVLRKGVSCRTDCQVLRAYSMFAVWWALAQALVSWWWFLGLLVRGVLFVAMSVVVCALACCCLWLLLEVD